MPHRTAHWRPPKAPLPEPVPAHLRGWLHEPGSLTQRLRAYAGSAVVCHRLGEGWRRPVVDEAFCLGLHPKRYAWTREVWLGASGTPRVFARTVAPAELLRGPLARLARLGDRPLGDLLFGRRSVSRGAIAIARLRSRDWLYRRLAVPVGRALAEEVWARRSVFHVGRCGLLVTEVFLSPWLFEEGQE